MSCNVCVAMSEQCWACSAFDHLPTETSSENTQVPSSSGGELLCYESPTVYDQCCDLIQGVLKGLDTEHEGCLQIKVACYTSSRVA